MNNVFEELYHILPKTTELPITEMYNLTTKITEDALKNMKNAEILKDKLVEVRVSTYPRQIPHSKILIRN